jgi:hypothetical protein
VKNVPLGGAMAGLVLAGVCLCRSGKVRCGAGLMLVALLIVSLPGCGGGSHNNTQFNGGGPHNVARGKYTLTAVGTDTVNQAISGSVGVSVTVN